MGPATSAAQLRGNAAVAATTSHPDAVALGDTNTVRHRDTNTDRHSDADAIRDGHCDPDAFRNSDDHDTDLATARSNEDGLPG
jgi:hypothetical protein